MEISMNFKATRNLFTIEVTKHTEKKGGPMRRRLATTWTRFQGLRVPTIFFLRKRLASRLIPNFINIPK